ncbi:MAG: hypothetical protein NZ958_06880 [Bacteroidia bacterium]|nr:hypothetical protein [Bacteroidia bacterium]MDW8089421.1 hypothetical protein [Bacteroidia bacterium]
MRLVGIGLVAGLSVGSSWSQEARSAFLGTWQQAGTCQVRVIKSNLVSQSEASQAEATQTSTLTISADPQNARGVLIRITYRSQAQNAGASVSSTAEEELRGEVISNSELRIPRQQGAMSDIEGTAKLEGGRLTLQQRVVMNHDGTYHEAERICTYNRGTVNRPPIQRAPLGPIRGR